MGYDFLCDKHWGCHFFHHIFKATLTLVFILLKKATTTLRLHPKPWMGRLASSPLLFWVWFKKQNAHSNKHSISQNTLSFLFFSLCSYPTTDSLTWEKKWEKNPLGNTLRCGLYRRKRGHQKGPLSLGQGLVPEQSPLDLKHLNICWVEGGNKGFAFMIEGFRVKV
jgi:hypothetical protein